MVQALNPRCQLPHRDYFNRVTIPQLYAEVCAGVEKKLTENGFFFLSAADLWSSRTIRPYLSYTVHYI